MFNNFSPNPSFNNYIPYNSYTANMYQQTQQFASPQQQTDTNITFVNGIEGAKAFQMRPNQSVILMDSDNSKFYVKSTDNLGVAKISSYSFTEDEISQAKVQSQANTADSVAISKEEYSAILNKISELEVKTNELNSKLSELLS